jgi:hypothetical protein
VNVGESRFFAQCCLIFLFKLFIYFVSRSTLSVRIMLKQLRKTRGIRYKHHDPAWSRSIQDQIYGGALERSGYSGDGETLEKPRDDN